MNRTRGFVNQNRFKSGRAIKRLKKVQNKHQMKGQIDSKKWVRSLKNV